jgi:hypothetical protein
MACWQSSKLDCAIRAATGTAAKSEKKDFMSKIIPKSSCAQHA